MVIRLYATFRPLVGGKQVELAVAPGESVGQLLRRLITQYPGLDGQLLSSDGESLLPYVQVFIAGRSIRDLDGLATLLPAEGDLAIFPPVAGG